MPDDAFDYETILRVLIKHEVEYIVVGGQCANFHGAPVQTYDLDIVQLREPANLEKLEAALRELGAYYREHYPKILKPEAARMGGVGHHLLRTSAGSLDVLGAIGNREDFQQLLPHTVQIEIGDGMWVRILDLPTLIATKEETGRAKDKLALPVLRRVLGEADGN